MISCRQHSAQTGAESLGGSSCRLKAVAAHLSLWSLLALVVFSLGFWPLRVSHDEWWHLKTGKWIVEQGHLPATDVFTYTAADYDWDNHEWLSQVGMYLVWRWGEVRDIGGWRALIFLKTLILIATYLLLGLFLYQRAGGEMRGLLIAVFLALVAAAVGRKTFWARPPVISYLFMVFFLHVMWLHRAGRLRSRWLIVLPLLMPLWANLHGGFLVGGIVVAAWFAGEAVEWLGLLWLARKREDADRAALAAKRNRVLLYLGVGICCGLGTLLTPYGYKLYLLSGRVLSSRDLVYRLSELLPPDFRFTWAYAFLLVLLGAGLLVLAIRSLLRWSPQWPPLADLLLVGVFFQQSISHVRHLPWFGLVGAPLGAWMLARCWAALGERRSRLLGASLLAGTGVCALWLVLLPGEALGVWAYLRQPDRVILAPSSLQYNRHLCSGQAVVPGSYPTEAVNFVLRARLPGRMFNRNNIAGYLIWRLSPEHYRVFTDSRFDIFGGDFLMDEISVAKGAESEAGEEMFLMPFGTPLPDWRDVVEKWQINWLFLDRSEEVNDVLSRPGSGWALIYLDRSIAIWLRRLSENLPWIDRYETPLPPGGVRR